MVMFTRCYIEHLLNEILWYLEKSKVEVLPAEPKAKADNIYRDLDYSRYHKKLN